ncbi:MAG: imidazole glycerol phosphate synthase subunit HisF [Gammaproteobacteria bacterium]
MLKVRVIPTLLWKGFGLVKGVGFDSWRRVGTVLPALKVYNSRDVDELVLMDITATPEDHPPDREAISDFSDECFVPLTVGGGIRNLQQIADLLHAGADKVSLNSATFERPQLVDEAAARFGAQCIVASIDVRRHHNGSYTVFSHCGTRPTGRDPIAWARELGDRGAGEILLTSIERDGTLQGYDLRLVELVAAAVGIPVIASGGAGTHQHMVDVIQQAGASAVAAASMFHFTEQTPAGVKQALAAAGIPVRRNFVAV